MSVTKEQIDQLIQEVVLPAEDGPDAPGGTTSGPSDNRDIPGGRRL